MIALLDRVLNGYRGTDTSAMVLEELQKENTKLNANLSRMLAVLAWKWRGCSALYAVRNRPIHGWRRGPN